MASLTELSFHLTGFLCALSSTIFTSVNSILAEVMLSKGKGGEGHAAMAMDPINGVYFMSPMIALSLAPLAFFLEAPAVVKWQFEQAEGRSMAWAAVILSGVLALGLNFSLLLAIGSSSAMAFNVAGNLKVALAMLLGWAVYRNPMSGFSTLGCVVTVGGCLLYGMVQMQQRGAREERKEE